MRFFRQAIFNYLCGMDRHITIMAAPLQGITDSVWRNAQAHCFGGVDIYYTPFLRREHGQVRRLGDAAPEANGGLHVVPQILGGRPDECVAMARALSAMGHRQVDINLGCPFPPVALHRRGSGLLPHPDQVAALAQALAQLQNIRFSVKMRLGWQNEREWEQVLPALAALNPTQVTLHPRTGREQYKGELHQEQLAAFVQTCPYPVVYNGGITTTDDIATIAQRFPRLHGVMIGRGLVARPGFLHPDENDQRYRLFHQELLDGYSQRLTGGEHQLLKKMQTLWEHFLPEANRKARKAIKKARTLEQYAQATRQALAHPIKGI